MGHSCFLLEYNESKLLIDPGKKHHSETDGDIVYSTHYHYDHTSGIERFLEKNSPDAEDDRPFPQNSIRYESIE